MSKKFLVIVLLIFVAILAGCGGSSSPSPSPTPTIISTITPTTTLRSTPTITPTPTATHTPTPTVTNTPTPTPSPNIYNGYIAGGVSYDGTSIVPCYWLDGVKHDLPGTGYINAIDTFGSDVYCAGYYISGGNYYACYWKNDDRFNLPSSVSDITLMPNALSISSTGNVYIGVIGRRWWWKDGVLITPGSFDHYEAIYAIGTDVYYAGYYYDSTPIFTYWKNGTPYTMDTPAWSTGFGYGVGQIMLLGSDVYVPGQYNVDYTGNVTCYWKNGVRFDLPALGSNPYLSNIYISGTDIYLWGFKRGYYWKNDAKITLSSNQTTMAISGTDIYIFGNTPSASNLPCYWKNGTQVNMPYGAAQNGFTSAICFE